jgi:hypothetical protein
LIQPKFNHRLINSAAILSQKPKLLCNFVPENQVSEDNFDENKSLPAGFEPVFQLSVFEGKMF